MDASAYIPRGQGPIGYKINEWIANKLGLQTEEQQAAADRAAKAARQQQEDANKQFEIEQNLRKEGYIPLDTVSGSGKTAVTGTQPSAQKGTGKFKFPKPGSAGGAPSATPGGSITGQLAQRGMSDEAKALIASGAQPISDPYGNRWVFKGKPEDQTSAELTLNEALSRGAYPLQPFTIPGQTEVPGVQTAAPLEAPTVLGTGTQTIEPPPPAPLPLMHSLDLSIQPRSNVPVRGAGGQQYYVPSGPEQEEAKAARETAQLKERLAAEAANRAPHFLIDGVTAPVLVDPATGKGTKVQLPEGVTVKEPAARYSYEHPVDDKGVVTHYRSSDTGVEKWNGKAWVPAPAGEPVGKSKDTGAADDRRERAEQARRDRIQKTADALEAKEHQQYKLMAEYGTLLNNPDTDASGVAVKVPIPGSESKALVKIKDVRAKYQALYQSAKANAQMYLDQKRKVLASGGVIPAQPAEAGAQVAPGVPQATAPTGAAPVVPAGGAPNRIPPQAGAQGPQKQATPFNVKAYAQQKGISEAQAIREFKAAGYSIVGQQ